MYNIKRRGVIAALFAGVLNSYTVRAQNITATTPTYIQTVGLVYKIEFQKGDRKETISDTKYCRPAGTFGLICDVVTIPELQYVLEIKYGDREVKLTAQEIMDILQEPTILNSGSGNCTINSKECIIK